MPTPPLADPLSIHPLAGPFDVSLRPPGSKSLTNRALLLASLARGACVVEHPLFADDTRVMLTALAQLGHRVEVDEAGGRVVVMGRGPATGGGTPITLHLGNAGTAVRFLTAALSLSEHEHTQDIIIDGVPRMRQRPIAELVDPLRRLGAQIQYLKVEGFPPLRITPARLRGGMLDMRPTLSSQYISALLMIGPRMPEGLVLQFDGPITSRPYVAMTLDLMHHFGAYADVADDGSRVRVPGSNHPDQPGYRATHYHVEPDASSATYFLAAAAITPGSRVTIEGLGTSSLQGDAAFAHVLGGMGAVVEQTADRTTLAAPPDGRLHPVDVDLNAMPDPAQTLAVVALFAEPGEGPTVMRNIGNLRVKETDRIAALYNELSKLGATVTITGNDMSIQPPQKIKRGDVKIDTYDDHRMAMAFTLAGLRRAGVLIRDPGCVAKTFPTYFQMIDRLRGGTTGGG